MKKNNFLNFRILVIVSLTFLGLGSLSAQNVMHPMEIKGLVTDSNNAPLPGASITIKDTHTGTITDIDGNYSILASTGTILQIKFIGMKTVEVTVGNLPTIKIVMEEDAIMLEQVVAIGYGTLKSGEISSAVTQIDRDNFTRGAVNSPIEMIAGKVPGLSVVSTAPSNPQSGASMQIRGAGSLYAGTGPLIVVDDVPGASMESISPQDIESITVLKDAGSAAIYGTRGANGVILITTKKGASGTESFSTTYDSWVGMKFTKNEPRMLNGDEYRALKRGTDYGGNSNWYKEMLRNTPVMDINQYVSFNKSGKGGYANLSLNYRNNDGINIGNSKAEYGGRFNYMQKAFKELVEFSFSANVKHTKGDVSGYDEGVTEGIIVSNPTFPVYNQDGSYYNEEGRIYTNPVQYVNERSKEFKNWYILASAGVKLNIFTKADQSLNTSIRGTYEYSDYQLYEYIPSSLTKITGNEAGYAEIYNRYNNNRTFEWLANYTVALNTHSLKAVLGYSYQDFIFSEHGMSNSDFTFDEFLWNDIGSGSYLKEGLAHMRSNKTSSKLISVFGRVNYNWNDLVFASATLRHEGSSKFGVNNKWGWFPAVSVASELSNLSFMENIRDVVNKLKLRVSYGVTGRQDFNSYMSLTTYRTSQFNSSDTYYLMNGKWVNAFEPNVNPNPNLKWEKNVISNLGVDFSLFNNRLYGTIDLFDRTSRDLLYNYNAPQPPMIYDNILVNVGTIKNRGLEISVGGNILTQGPVNWSAVLNYSTGKTKVDKLSNDIYSVSYIDMYQLPVEGSRDFFFRYTEGSEIGQFWGYKHAGFDNNGNFMVYNKDGEAVSKGSESPDDKEFIGSGVPKAFLSLENTIRYKNFDLRFLFRSALGFKIFNYQDYVMGYRGCVVDNVLAKAYFADRVNIKGDPQILTSYHVKKGDYLKLENINIGYTKEFKSDYIQSLRVYLSASNLFTITSYDGNDPSLIDVNGLMPGIDVTTSYPNAFITTLGLTLNF